MYGTRKCMAMSNEMEVKETRPVCQIQVSEEMRSNKACPDVRLDSEPKAKETRDEKPEYVPDAGT